MNTSWRIGRPFGVELRVHWMVALMPVLAWSYTGHFLSALLYSLAVYLVVYTHEMGHIAAGWRYGIPTDRIVLSPLGGVAHMQGAGPTPLADIVVSLAGPATHGIWMLLSWLAVLAVGTPTSWIEAFPRGFFGLNLSLALFNLLPFHPLDGGRVLAGLLSLRWPETRARSFAIRLGQVGAVLFIVGGFLRLEWAGFQFGSILVAIGISNLLVCRQSLAELRYGGGDRVRREAWESDPEAWRRGVRPDDDGGAAARKARREQARRMEEDEALEKELDRLLEKVHREGLPSLTGSERKTLQKAAEKRQRR